MGFKCPYCLKDFGINKIEWNHHLKTDHNGFVNDIVKAITNTYENMELR